MKPTTKPQPPFPDLTFKSKEGEKILIEHFAKDWDIIPAGIKAQKLGIDFFFRSKKNGDSYRIGIKTDAKASLTGNANAFIETYSSYPDKKGWAYTTHSEIIFYFLPQDRLVYCLKPHHISIRLHGWAKRYRAAVVRNKGWETRGILVPLHELETIATQVISL